jgi:hypothetical protein
VQSLSSSAPNGLPKDQFPTEDAYSPTLRSTLRLVTCGGGFDPADGHYRSKVIVFATMAPEPAHLAQRACSRHWSTTCR